MKINVNVIAALVLFLALSVFGQSTFQNLNFEAANIPAGTQPGTEVSTNIGTPGWSASPILVYGGTSTGGAGVTLTYSNNPYITSQPLQGNYSVILFGGPDIGVNGASSISQTGLVPANAQSLQMDIAFPFGMIASAPFVVTLDGQSTSMSPLQTLQNYTVYGGNISAYADQVETLSITQFPPGTSHRAAIRPGVGRYSFFPQRRP
jgi:hypothetical protein